MHIVHRGTWAEFGRGQGGHQDRVPLAERAEKGRLWPHKSKQQLHNPHPNEVYTVAEGKQ